MLGEWQVKKRTAADDERADTLLDEGRERTDQRLAAASP